MNNKLIKIISKFDNEHKLYWTAFCDGVKACVGGGDTKQEAIKELKENLCVYLEYAKCNNNEEVENLINTINSI